MKASVAIIIVAACGTAANAQNGGYQATPIPVGVHPVILPPVTGGGVDASWSSIDGGGRVLQGGTLTLDSTLGQADAGILAAGNLELRGGFRGPIDEVAACYANCDRSTAQPILNINDFQCFLNQFTQGTAYANCDESTAAPVLNVIDFQCFLNKYATGCS